jgi:dimethylaniline monooxygenase (N-oxide forming)
LWELLPVLRGGDLRQIQIDLRTRRLVAELLSESGGTLHEQFGTKTDDFVREIAEGRCRRAPAIERFDGARVVFADGSAFEPDLVLFCTGFETRVPFLDSRVASTPRFLHTFNPEVGPTLAFIGFLRPSFGAIPPLAELQARWFAQVVSGNVALPDPAAMMESISREARHRARMFRAVRGRLDALVDHMTTCDALAAEIGCAPTAAAVRAESRPFRHRFVAGPFVAAQYRLVGPHAKPALARRVILDLPVTTPWLDRANLRLRWRLSRALRRFVGPEYAPKLELLAD